MELSVEAYCNLLNRSSLLSPQEVKSLYQRWKGEARDAAGDTEKFLKWLVIRQYVTEYQAKLIGRQQVDNFFLGQYKILDRIGQGRMAGIYKAVHRLGNVVAIKVLPPSKAKVPEFFQRFQREARMAMQLKHPNIVRTFQMAERTGLFYIVMEYLEGEPFDDVLKKKGKLPVVEAVRVVYQSLLGLQHIHEKGLVHRDLKPANLMLVPPPGETTMNSTVKILDIGLGKVMFDEDAPAQAPEAQLTTDGAMLGSPIYMAPEQARKAHDADIRSDMYTLGCVLYHALAGQPPFVDPNVVRIMIKHASEAPPPLKQFNPAIPDGLQHMVCDYLLAKDPTKRFQTPERAAASLQVFLAQSSEVIRPLEAEPQMADYLRWLDSEGGGEPALAGVAGGPPASAPRLAQGAVTPTRPSAQGAVTPTRPSAHGNARPAAIAIDQSLDVELVPVASASPGASPPKSRMLLGILIGVGFGVIAVVIAVVLSQMLGRK